MAFLIGIVTILLCGWVLFSAIKERRYGKPDRLTSLCLSALFAYGMLWNLTEYTVPLVSGLSGGIGFCFFVNYLHERIHFNFADWPWWASVTSAFIGAVMLLNYSTIYQGLPDFLQGLIVLPYVLVVFVAFTGAILIFMPKQNASNDS